MIVKLPYGRDWVAVDLRGLKIRPLQSTAPRGVSDLGRLLSRAVDYPLAGEALITRAKGRRSAVVVVPDATRRASLPEVLPVIVNRLLAAGLDPGSITILVACGTHPPAPEGELAELDRRAASRRENPATFVPRRRKPGTGSANFVPRSISGSTGKRPKPIS